MQGRAQEPGPPRRGWVNISPTPHLPLFQNLPPLGEPGQSGRLTTWHDPQGLGLGGRTHKTTIPGLPLSGARETSSSWPPCPVTWPQWGALVWEGGGPARNLAVEPWGQAKGAPRCSRRAGSCVHVASVASYSRGLAGSASPWGGIGSPNTQECEGLTRSCQLLA